MREELTEQSIGSGRLHAVSATLLDVAAVRRRFSSLQGDFVFLDAPGGSQVPDEVGDAIARCLREASANIGAPYETSRRVQEILDRARGDAGRFLNCSSDDVIFGTNMTTLDFMLSRTASRDWKEGDRILVSRLDHDGGVAPWVELAADRGFEVDWIDVDDELRLDLDDLANKLDERVRVVACVVASNAVGTVTDVKRVAALAHEAGALAWVDAVHYAAHEPIDVQDLDCDVLLCSPYKYCGPHLGLAYGKHELLESWRPYKARPAGSTPVGRKFETGTAPYELLAGFSATIAYLESIGGMEVLRDYERSLGDRFMATVPETVEIYGVPTMVGRVPTFLLHVDGVPAAQGATTMAVRGYGVWAHDNWYSLGLREKLPYPNDAVRVGFIHYNTVDEVDGFVAELAAL
jgi:cysteine desulfurase family protein (TIGR01976 family)